MQNVECKYELRDLPLARSIARAIGSTFIGTLKQKDTYYRLTAGRLKRRECIGESPEFIFYDRSDESRPRLSNFTIYTESEAQTRFGTHPLPVWLTVFKTRDLFMFENVRIHLDTVENLGTFLEFEALVSPSHHMSQCHSILNILKAKFAPALGEPLSTSYADLLSQQRPSDLQSSTAAVDLPEIEPPKLT